MNILSIMLCLADMWIDTDTIWTHVYSIEGLAHRIEKIAVHSDITYIDDSKSTSCQSLVAALSSFPSRNVIWIGGGSDKGDTFEGLENILWKIVKYAVLIWATRDILAAKCISANVPYIYAESMHEAVYSAVSVGTAGDTVLLSPGCASFGMFRDYLDRAQQFRDAVERVCRG
jgi:UDP-N-acetylmuramoylalanine--D-glutamate ligase